MNKFQSQTRRSFLKSASFVTAAAAGLAGTHGFDLPRRSKAKARKLKLGIRPETCTPGPIVHETGNLVFLTFYGCQENERGRDLGDGTAVVTLKGCKNWRLRSPLDEEIPSHSIDLESLDFCEAYEIIDSDWNPNRTPIQSPNRKSIKQRRRIASRPRRQSPNLKHLVFTFFGFDPGLVEGGVHFECLTKSYKVEFFPDANYDSLVDLMELREITS